MSDTISLSVSHGEGITNCNISDLVDAYNKFVDDSCKSNPTFDFWSFYIDMVQMMLLHIRATRTSDWDLHLKTIRMMMPWFFVTDRVNYSRYLPCYWLEMINLPQTHPCTSIFFLIYIYFLKGVFFPFSL